MSDSNLRDLTPFRLTNFTFFSVFKPKIMASFPEEESSGFAVGSTRRKRLNDRKTSGESKSKKRLVLRGLCEECKKKQKPGNDMFQHLTRADVVMLKAANDGHVNCVKACLDAGANVNQLMSITVNRNAHFSSNSIHYPTSGSYYTTALIKASENRHYECLSLLVESGADVNVSDENGPTALFYVASAGHYNCLDLLLKAGADVNASRCSTSLLNVAIRSSKFSSECVNALIKAGGDVNETGYDGQTPLFALISGGKTENVRSLIQAGTDVNSQDSKGRTVLMHAVLNDDPVRYLIEAGADVNIRDNHGKTALKLALKYDSGYIDELIEAGADVNMTYEGGRTALSIAAFATWISAHVTSLITVGADVNIRDRDGSTVLMSASSRGCGDVVELLVALGVDVNSWNRTGEAAVVLAASRGHTGCLETLIGAGADVNSWTKCGETALKFSLTNGFDSCFDQLISAGADVNIRYTGGCTILSLASTLWMNAPVNTLIALGTDVNVVDFWRNTPLHLVSYVSECSRSCSKAIQCIKSLLTAGAKVNMLNVNYTKALMSYFQFRRRRVSTPLQTCLSTMLKKGCKSPICNGSCEAQMITLFFAAGETVDDYPVKVSDYLDPPSEICLSHICREAIREYLLQLDPHENLFYRAKKLGLPSALQEYLLYNVTLEDNEEDKDKTCSTD